MPRHNYGCEKNCNQINLETYLPVCVSSQDYSRQLSRNLMSSNIFTFSGLKVLYINNFFLVQIPLDFKISNMKYQKT